MQLGGQNRLNAKSPGNQFYAGSGAFNGILNFFASIGCSFFRTSGLYCPDSYRDSDYSPTHSFTKAHLPTTVLLLVSITLIK